MSALERFDKMKILKSERLRRSLRDGLFFVKKFFLFFFGEGVLPGVCIYRKKYIHKYVNSVLHII